MAKEIKKVVLAYSGGLDTSIIIPWLKENYNNCEVIAVSGDVGQGTELDGLEEKAIKTGASKLYIEDLNKEFVEDFVFPTVKAGAVYEGRYLLGTSFARPVIAKRIVEIAKKEGAEKPEEYNSPRQYSMGRHHKHIKEMMAVSGLSYPPIFNPIVDDYYNGMVVTIPLHLRAMAKKTSAQHVWEVMAEHYEGQNFVKVMPFQGEGVLADGFLAANTLKDTNLMQIFVFGNEDHVLLCSRLDNLGKGASGAAVQCMNIMMGIDETTGLL